MSSKVEPIIMVVLVVLGEVEEAMGGVGTKVSAVPGLENGV